MFSKILGKSKAESKNSEIEERVSKMELEDMRVYVNNKLKDFPVSEDGLVEIMRKLVTPNSKTSKKFVDEDAMDVKIKKLFDLVILISASKKISVVTTELIQEFIELYSEMIEKFDKDNKQIYESKLKKSLLSAMASINSMTALKHKMDFLGQ